MVTTATVTMADMVIHTDMADMEPATASTVAMEQDMDMALVMAMEPDMDTEATIKCSLIEITFDVSGNFLIQLEMICFANSSQNDFNLISAF